MISLARIQKLTPSALSLTTHILLALEAILAIGRNKLYHEDYETYTVFSSVIQKTNRPSELLRTLKLA
jgi:hypothetical protein